MKKQKKALKINKEGYYIDTADAATTRYPSPLRKDAHVLSNEKKIDLLEKKFREVLEILGLDLNDESLQRTPLRIAKMYVNEVFAGLDPKNFPLISTVPDHYHHEQKSNIVFVRVSFTSFCEHHFVPLVGNAYVAYRPRERLIGLSKIPRVVRYFARRPQLQERLTAQIADSISTLLDTADVAVSISATHYCVVARGIEDEGSHTITNVFRGEFESNPVVRQEFYDAMNRIK